MKAVASPALAAWAVLVVLVIALPVFADAGLNQQEAEGRRVMKRAQCNRCHEVSASENRPAADGLPRPPREQSCVDCHTWILGTRGDTRAIERQRREYPDWDRSLQNIVHLTRLPHLGTIARRVEPAFLRRYLDGPFDLRPHLEESMVPLRLSASERDAVVAYLVALSGRRSSTPPSVNEAGSPKPEVVSQVQINKGRLAFLGAGCAMCHVLGGERLVAGFTPSFFKALGPQAMLAPNLQFARERLKRETFVAFVQDPQSIDPHVTMPNLGLSREQAESIADFVLNTPIQFAVAPPPVPPAVPLLDREVPYSEVHREVFGLICVHCHMDPASNLGDGGAGNTGGLGFEGKGLVLETYKGLRRGLRRPDGTRLDVLVPRPGQTESFLIEVLLRRHEEARRDGVPAFATPDLQRSPIDPDAPGMPMGLPPLSLSKLSLVKTWIAQGARP